MPGAGTIYLSQSTRFIKPVYICDTITASVRVIEKNEEKNKIKLYTKCINQNSDIVIEGESIVMPPK